MCGERGLHARVIAVALDQLAEGTSVCRGNCAQGGQELAGAGRAGYDGEAG